jgi:hypothetical protein
MIAHPLPTKSTGILLHRRQMHNSFKNDALVLISFALISSGQTSQNFSEEGLYHSSHFVCKTEYSNRMKEGIYSVILAHQSELQVTPCSLPRIRFAFTFIRVNFPNKRPGRSFGLKFVKENETLAALNLLILCTKCDFWDEN